MEGKRRSRGSVCEMKESGGAKSVQCKHNHTECPTDKKQQFLSGRESRQVNKHHRLGPYSSDPAVVLSCVNFSVLSFYLHRH